MTETNKRRLTRKNGVRRARGMRKTKYGGLRKTRQAKSFFGFGNQRQESESNKTATVVAALAVVPFDDVASPYDAPGLYEGGRLQKKGRLLKKQK
jgi:hypothetical protein